MKELDLSCVLQELTLEEVDVVTGAGAGDVFSFIAKVVVTEYVKYASSEFARGWNSV